MDIKKLAPWNWFKKEDELAGTPVPVNRSISRPSLPAEGREVNPLVQLHREMDRLFEHAFRGFGSPGLSSDFFSPLSAAGMLKPQVDIGATNREYSITVEVPGVSEKDVRIEIADNAMTIKGEKKQEKEEKNKDYYRVERSYGSFQRVLALPEDADQDSVKATFKKGVLTIRMNRKDVPRTAIKQIEVTSA